MTDYELVVLLHPDLEIDLDTPVKKVEELVKNSGGKVTKKDNWGKRKLAYPIKKQEFAVYVYWEIQLPAEGVAKLDRGLNISDEVLRHLIAHHVEAPEDEKSDSKNDEKPTVKKDNSDKSEEG